MALAWGYFFEGVVPDIYDIVGTIVAGIDVIIIFYYPRKEGEDIGINTSE
jgi:small multidrug resistance family-3 protein